MIVFGPGLGALQKVSASGGAPTAATSLSQGETSHWGPHFLPDGRHFLYRTAGESTGVGGPIYLASLDPTDRTWLLNADSSNVAYSQGHLLFLRETTLMAQPFDARRLALTGDAFPIAEQIQTQDSPTPLGVFSASGTGVLAYQTGSAAGDSRLVWFDRSGRQIGLLGDRAAYDSVALSPDGTRAAVSLLDPSSGTYDVWLYDVARGVRTRFTFDPGDEMMPIWSPDGGRIVFNSTRKGRLDLYQKASSGAEREEVLLEGGFDKYAYSWPPDGRYLLYNSTVEHPRTGVDIWVLPRFGGRKPFPFLETPFNEGLAQFSPDGRWIAYQSTESGRSEVYVAPFPGPAGKWQISTAGGSWARWRRDGREIFCLAADNKLMAAAVNSRGAAFEVGAVQPLFETRPEIARLGYDVSADGQRFLVNTLVEEAVSAPITLVVNWTVGLEK